MYYYVVDVAGQTCGHTHRDMGLSLAKCWRKAGKARARVWQCTSRDGGTHTVVPSASLAPLRALLPSREPGRPAGQTTLTEQGKPLYVRLSVAERERYEGLARAAGMELGPWVLSLMEKAEIDAAEAADPGLRLMARPASGK
jgi:hypothetical protein